MNSERLARLAGAWGWSAPSVRLDAIVESGGRYLIMNEGRTRVLGGPYAARAEAEARLRQVEYFKAHRPARTDAVIPHPVLAGETRAHATARVVSLHRATGQAVPRRRLPRQLYPHAIESDYARALVGLVDGIRGTLAPYRADIRAAVAEARNDRRVDSLLRTDAGADRMKALLERARAAVDRLAQPRDVEALARKFAQQTSTYQRIQLGKQVKAALGVDVLSRDRRLPAIIDQFVHENVALIKTIPQRLFSDVEGVVTRSVTGGALTDDLDEEIDDRFGVGEFNARRIARDQTGKLYGQVNAYRQQDLGITKFTWRTVEDERVRPEHEALDGKEFSYDDPPDEGLPGEPILCRCGAEPIFSDIAGLVGDLEDDT